MREYDKTAIEWCELHHYALVEVVGVENGIMTVKAHRGEYDNGELLTYELSFIIK